MRQVTMCNMVVIATRRHNKGTKFDPIKPPRITYSNSSSGGLWTFSNYCKSTNCTRNSSYKINRKFLKHKIHLGTAASTEGTEVQNLLTNIQTTVNAGNLTGQDTETTSCNYLKQALQSSITELPKMQKQKLLTHCTSCKSIQDFVFQKTKHYVTEIFTRWLTLLVMIWHLIQIIDLVTAGNMYYRVNAQHKKFTTTH